jgi:hypothetical protein
MASSSSCAGARSGEGVGDISSSCSTVGDGLLRVDRLLLVDEDEEMDVDEDDDVAARTSGDG